LKKLNENLKKRNDKTVLSILKLTTINQKDKKEKVMMKVTLHMVFKREQETNALIFIN